VKPELKDTIDKHRKKTSVDNFYYNRFLGVRYLSALLIVTNVYWLIALILSGFSWAWILPIIPLAVSLPAIAEQVRLFRAREHEAPHTKRLLQVTVAINVISGVMVMTPLFSNLYPFIVKSPTTQNILLLILLSGILLSMIGLVKLKRVAEKRDRLYAKIQAYEKSVKE
jgi:hypothetical protein